MAHRYSVHLKIALIVLIAALAAPLTAFAEGGSVQAKAVKPRPVSSTEVQQYSTYHKKNTAKIPVITYHKIVSDKAKKSSKYRKDKWSVSQSNFNKQMNWLHKRHYRTINCDEFYLWRMGKIKLPARSVLITIDDGNAEAIRRALPVIKKYNMKCTAFIIGKKPYEGIRSNEISLKNIRKIQEDYPEFEFQSHTYNLHTRKAVKYKYSTFMKDAAKQRAVFGFDYLAYPYGKKTKTMIRAYKDSGIRMAFSFADYGYATRNQNIYKIKRIAIFGSTSLSKFKKWCR